MAIVVMCLVISLTVLYVLRQHSVPCHFEQENTSNAKASLSDVIVSSKAGFRQGALLAF